MSTTDCLASCTDLVSARLPSPGQLNTPGLEWQKPLEALVELAAAPFHRWHSADGSVWLEFYRDGDGYLLHFPDLADFMVSRVGETQLLRARPGLPHATLEQLYLNQVYPLALSRRGYLVLHASAVEVDGRALVFLGPSGMGKSTLASSFAKAGFPFLADDGVIVELSGEQPVVLPGHASLRLHEDAYSFLMPHHQRHSPSAAPLPKVRIQADSQLPHCGQALPFAGLYILGAGHVAESTITAVGAQQTVHTLLQHGFLLDIEEQEHLRHHFHLLGALARTERTFMLDYPREFRHLGCVVDDVVRHLRLGSGVTTP